MRKIQVYDTTQTEFNNHIVEFDAYDFDEYKEKIIQSIGCLPSSLLEISSKSNSEFGKKLCAASLSINCGTNKFCVESLYQGSKYFSNGIDFNFFYEKNGNEVLKKKVNFKNKEITKINFFGNLFSSEFLSEFYDVLYWIGLEQTLPQIKKSMNILKSEEINYFSDFFDKIGGNSQAKSFAYYYWKWKKNESVFDFLTDFQKEVIKIINIGKFNKTHYTKTKIGLVKSLF